MNVTSFLNAAIQAGTPLLFATLGEILTEKAGNLNLGAEGTMLIGAIAGFLAGMSTANPFFAVLGAAAGGAIFAAIYAFLTVTLKANQVVTGLSLTILGTGISSFVGKDLNGMVVPDSIKGFFAIKKIPLLGDIPFIGTVFFKQDLFVYLGYITAVILFIYIYKTRFGLNLRMVGENPSAADASGINVDLYKYVHILLGGALSGLGGAYLSLVYVPAWQENVTAGRGWIAVALVIFATWNPLKALFSSYFFGGLDILGFRLQKYDMHVSQYMIDMLPYAATIFVLIMISMRKKKEYMPPKELGNAYFREER
jgi:simple sugar transport system permease protein